MSGVRGTYYPVAALPDTNARSPAMTQRPASTALLTIDSEDRYADYDVALTAPTSPYNFSISKSESLMAGFMTRIGISEVVFPWMVPNVNAKTCTLELLYVPVGGGATVAYDIVLPQQFYSPSQLATASEDIVHGIPGNPLPLFTMIYGSGSLAAGITTGSCAFSYSSGSTATVGFQRYLPNVPEWPFPAGNRQLFDVMGFVTANEVLAVTGAGTATFAQSIRYIDIVCNQLTNSQAQKDQTSQLVARDMLCRLYIGGASGVTSTISPDDPLFCPPGCAPTTLYRNFATPKQIQWIPNQNIPGFLQFQVYDDQGDLLDTAYPGFTLDTIANNWSMTMLVTEN
jgi:hypothetical protein